MKRLLISIMLIIILSGSIVIASIKTINKNHLLLDDSSTYPSKQQQNLILENIAYDGEEYINQQLSSGPVEEVPWVNDENFKNALEQSGVNNMLAAYRTVLKDPLPGEEYNVHLAANTLSGIVLKSQEIFSQNQLLGPYTKSQGYQEGPTYAGSKLIKTYGGGVCKIASTLYNVTVLSNLKIVERHAHSMPVPYVPYGQDATVAYGVKDFKFQNSSDTQILIWAQAIDNILYIAFYGNYIPPAIEWNHEILKTFKASVIYKTNPDLSPIEEKIVLEGMDGAVVKSWIIIKNSDGTNSIKQMGTSYYSPMPYIVERGK